MILRAYGCAKSLLARSDGHLITYDMQNSCAWVDARLNNVQITDTARCNYKYRRNDGYTL